MEEGRRGGEDVMAKARLEQCSVRGHEPRNVGRL